MKNFLCKILLKYMSLKLKKYTSDITIIFRCGLVSQRIGTGNIIYDINFKKFKDILLLIFHSASLSFGEAYFRGDIEIKGSLAEFVFVIDKNFNNKVRFSFLSNLNYFKNFLLKQFSRNSMRQSVNNVRAHYDHEPGFYEIFLDKSMQYSCAYFFKNNMSIDEAQDAKKDLISKKLLLSENHDVLDIGCGWGGLALHMVKKYNCFVHGITLSQQQLNYAQNSIQNLGLDEKLKYTATDYRDVDRKYDRVVSIGMFEHVGLKNYKHYFSKIYDCLHEDGLALVHTIGRNRGAGTTDSYLSKYIFPGGYIPSLSEILPHIEKSNLVITDIEFLHMHYAETLSKWREKFLAQSTMVDLKFGEEFRRLWEYYLIISESAFRNEYMTVFQIQLSKKTGSVPVSRDYMYNSSNM